MWRDGVELDAGPRQQAFLLALLLAREGRPISTAELVHLLWGEGAPASALNVVHKYIGALRRLLEPALPVRETGSHLLRRGNGYLFTAGAAELDLVSFRKFVAGADAAVLERSHETALDHYVDALGLWTGPAGDGLAQGPAAMSIFAGLNDEFFDACTAAAELAAALGRPQRVLAPLHLAASIAPLHEPVQAGLITILGAAGRQVEALSVFRIVRSRLAEDLGLDPGQALEAAHRRVLSQTVDPRTGTPRRTRVDTPDGLVGRAEELAVLRQAVDAAFTGRPALALVEGEPGVGKTRLLQEITAEADRRKRTRRLG